MSSLTIERPQQANAKKKNKKQQKQPQPAVSEEATPAIAASEPIPTESLSDLSSVPSSSSSSSAVVPQQQQQQNQVGNVEEKNKDANVVEVQPAVSELQQPQAVAVSSFVAPQSHVQEEVIPSAYPSLAADPPSTPVVASPISHSPIYPHSLEPGGIPVESFESATTTTAAEQQPQQQHQTLLSMMVPGQEATIEEFPQDTLVPGMEEEKKDDVENMSHVVVSPSIPSNADLQHQQPQPAEFITQSQVISPVEQIPQVEQQMVEQQFQQQHQQQQLQQPITLQPQLSVPTMLQEQLAQRISAQEKVDLLSVQGPLQSDAASLALLHEKLTNMHSYNHWFERKAGALRGRFFELVEGFRTSQFSVCQVKMSSVELKHSVQYNQAMLWKLRQVRLEQKQVCGDGVQLEHFITHAVADFDVAGAEHMFHQLTELQRKAIQELTSHRFLAQSNALQVELYLSELLASKGLNPSNPLAASASSAPQRRHSEGISVPGGIHVQHEGGETPQPSPLSALPSNPSSSSSTSGSTLDFLQQLRYCIDVLFYFEKLQDPVQEQEKSLWKIKARERQERQTMLEAQKATNAAVLAAQPNQPISPEPPQLPAAASQIAASASPPAAGYDNHNDDLLEMELDADIDGELFTADAALASPAPDAANHASISQLLNDHTKFRQSVRKWLKLLIDALYTVGSYSDHLYILSQVLRCRGSTKWASFVQFARINSRDANFAAQQRLNDPHGAQAGVPGGMREIEGQMDGENGGVEWAWTDEFIQHLFASVALALTPLDAKNLKFQIQPSSIAASAASSSGVSAKAFEQVLGGGGLSHLGEWSKESSAEEGEAVRIAEEKQGASASPVSDSKPPMLSSPDSGAEWIVLDETKLKNALNPDVSYRVSLNESDYCTLIQHIPILAFIKSRFYPLFLSVAKRHVSTHLNERMTTGGSATSSSTPANVPADNAYDSFDRHQLIEAFTQTKVLLQFFTTALTRFPEYPQLSKLIAKQMCLIVGLIGESWKRAWKIARNEEELMQQENMFPGAAPSVVSSSSSAEDAAAQPQFLPCGLYPNPCCSISHEFYGLLQKELDFCLLRLTCSIQHCQISGIKFFLSDLPYHLLSSEAAGQAFLILMNQSHLSDYSNSSLTFTPLLLSNWFAYLSSQAGLQTRDNFASLLLNPNGGYIHVLMALTKLCTKSAFEISPFIIPPINSSATSPHNPHAQRKSSISKNEAGGVPGGVVGEMKEAEDNAVATVDGGEVGDKALTDYKFRSSITDLPLIYLNELFHISYLNQSTREELFRPAQTFITSICSTHPLAISFLLFLCHTYFRYIAAGAIALFEQIDLSAWRPTASDMYILQALLMTPSSTPSNELARFVLLNLNYSSILTNEPSKFDLHSRLQSQRGSIAEIEGAAAAAAAASAHRNANRSVDLSHVFFPPRPRAPLLGWQFHRALLLMLSEVRLVSIRNTTLTSSTSNSSVGAPNSSSAPPPPPFNSFINFPTAAFAHFLTAQTTNNAHSGHTSNSNSRRNSLHHSHILQTAMMNNSLPQPPPVEQHLHQQFEAQQLQQRQALLANGQFSSAPPLPSSATMPAFSSLSNAPTATGANAPNSNPLALLLAPASTLLTEVFSSNTKKPIDPSWWLKMLSLLATRDTDGSVPFPVLRCWLSQRFSVLGVDLEDYTNLVMRDPVLSYIQLQVSWVGTESHRFANSGWQLVKGIMADSTYANLGVRALHDLLPALLHGAVLSQANSPMLKPAASSPSWQMISPSESAGLQPPPLALGPASSAPSLASQSFSTPNQALAGLPAPYIGNGSGTPPRGSSRRGSLGNQHLPHHQLHGSSIPPSNPFVEHSGSAPLHHSASHSPILQPSMMTPNRSFMAQHNPVDAYNTLAGLQILKHLVEQSRPKSMFAFIQSKSVTYDGTQLVASIISAQLIASMKAGVDAGGALVNPELLMSPLHVIFNFWSGELSRAPLKPNELWTRDHNFRFLFDTLCQTVFLWNDWLTEPREGAVINANMKLLYKFIGEQSVTHAMSTASHPSAIGNMGIERRNGNYLSANALVGAIRPSQAGAPQDDVEIKYDWFPNAPPPKHVVDTLNPPESILSAFSLSAKDAVNRHPFATFVALMEETIADRSALMKFGYMLCRWDLKSVLKVTLKSLGIIDDKIRRHCMVRRWFVHALACPTDCPLLPLYWQMAFRLMFARMHLDQPLHSNMGGFFGYRFMTGTSGRVLMQQCREQLLVLAEVFAQKRLEVINSNKNGSPLIHPSVYELPALFTAMHAWLTAEQNMDPATHLNSLRERLLGFGVTLQEKFMPSHLGSILLPTADRMAPLWMEMVDLAKLRWDQFQQLTSHTQTALLIPSPQLFTVHSPLSNEGLQYAFFHRYYHTQNYRLSTFAPSPQHLVAIMKRKRGNTSTTGNPFGSSVPSASDIQAMFSSTEFASPLISRQVGEVIAGMARALALSGAVVGIAAGKKGNKNASQSSSVWSASFTPIPLPVLASPASSMSLASGAAAASSSSIDHMLSFQIPSILLAPFTDLFSHDSELLQPLRESIRLFTDRYSRCTALDRHMLDSLLPHLFRNEQADFHVSVPCRVGWGGASKCRMPVQFYFNFSRALKIRQIEENIDQNRQQAGLCLEMSATAAVMAEIGVAFCASLIAVQRIIRHLLQAANELQQPASHSHGMMMGEGSAIDRQHELIECGVRWLFSLASVDSSVSALFPPAHYFLHTSIASLSPLLNHAHVHSVKQQQQLLETLVGHVGLIPLLSNSIEPISITKHDPNAYLHLFRLALNVRDADGVTSTTVMQRFDVKKWLQTANPPLMLKQQFFSMVAVQLREEEKHPRRRAPANAANAAPAETLCVYYAQVLLDLALTSDFTEMFDVALPSILEDVKAFGVQQAPHYPQIVSVPPQVAQSNPAAICPTAPRAANWLHHLLHGLSRAPLHQLPWEAVLKSAQSIETALWQIRRSHNEHVKQVLSQQQRAPVISHSNLRVHLVLGNLLPTLCQFYRSLFTATHPSFYPSATLESKTSAVICYASSIDKKNACWNAIWQCMSAFLAPDPPPLINNNTLPQNAPLNLYIDTQQQLMIDTFVFVISLLKSSGKSEENWVFLRFWNCYTNQITVNADVHFLYMLHQTVMKCTKIPQPIDMDQPASAVNKYPIPGVFYTSIPAQPVLDFHSSWFLTSSQLLSFTNTLKQVTEMHEKEVKSMIAIERSRRETEHNQKIQLARGTKREGKLGSIIEVRRSDVKLMSQFAVKVESIAAFISHLIASSNWSYFLQQKSRFVPAALKVPDNQVSSGSEGVAPAVPEEADAQQAGNFVSPQGMYEPAVITNPYELFEASPATDYATTLLVTIVHVLSELPSAPFSAAAASSSAPAITPVLPHFQQMLNTLLHIDWIAVFLLRLPFEAFQMRHSKKQNAASAEQIGEEEALFNTPSVPVANEDDIDDGLPKSTLPSPEEMHSLGLAALDREVGTTQTLLEQISMILYSDRIVAKVVDEISFMNLQSLNTAAKDAASNAVRPNLLASLLTNPLGALSSSSTSANPGVASAASASLTFEKKEDLSVCRSPMPGVSVGLLGDPDLQGLIRAHYNTRSHQLLQRYSSDFKTDELVVNTPLTRITFVFHLMYRLCAPMPPIPYLQHPNSASNKFHFVPLVVLLRRTRLYAEWLLSVFNNGDGDAPRPLMLEQSYLDIAGALLSHLNDYHDLIQVIVGDEEFIPVLQEFMFVANLEARGVSVSKGVKALTDRIFSPQNEKLTLLAVTACCRSIISLDKLAQFLEQVLQVWKDSHANEDVSINHLSRPNHWQTVSATLQVPEISFDEFIFACLNNGSILTLHVVSVQQLMMSAKMISNPYSAASAVSVGGGNSAAGASSSSAAAAARHNMLEAVPATPSPSSLLDPLKKHTMAQPRAIVLAAAASGSSPAMPLLTQPLDPKPIQQRVEQLLQWLLKTQVKTAEQRRGPKGSAAAAFAAANPFVPVNGVEEEDLEAMKLLVILRTLLEWQGALVKGFFRARGVPVYEPTRPIRWSNPLLNHIMLYPDPCPILTFADSLIDQMQQLLVKWLQETKSTDGLLGMMGLNSSPKYSVKFRLLLKALHTYFMLQAQPTLAATVTHLSSGQLKSHKAPPLHFCWDVNGGQATFLPAVARFGILQQFTAFTSQKAFLPVANQARVAGGIVSQAAEIASYTPHNPATSVFVPLIYSADVLDQLVHCLWPAVSP